MSFFCVVNADKVKKIVVNGLIACAVLIVFCATFFAGGVQTTSQMTNALTPIYKGNENNKNVSLMFNVYWGNEYIDGILQTLEDKKIKATFFVGGSWVKNNPELFKKIVNAQHEIGNHGYLHLDCAKISSAKIKDEIERTNRIIKDVGGVEAKLFAPPSGSFSQTSLQIAKDLGMHTIMWSKDTIDWRDKNESLVFQRATKNVTNGDLILMHPTDHTLKALAKVIDDISSKEFQLVPVGDNI